MLASTPTATVEEIDPSNPDFAILQQQLQRIEGALRRHILSARRQWEAFVAQTSSAELPDAEREVLARWQFRLPDWGSPAHKRTLREAAQADIPSGSRLALLVERFRLDAFERDALLLSLLPLANPVGGLLFACLQEGAQRQWPEAEIALNLFAEDALDKERKRASLAPSATLIREALVRVGNDTPGSDRRTELQASSRIYAFVCGADPRHALASTRELQAPDLQDLAPDLSRKLAAYCIEPARPALMIALQGESDGTCQIALAHAGGVAGTPMLLFDLEESSNDEARFQTLFVRVLREATIHAAGLALKGLDVLWEKHPALHDWIAERLRGHRFALFSLNRRGEPLVSIEGVAQIVVNVPASPVIATTQLLRTLLSRRDADPDIDVDMLVRRFRPALDTLTQSLHEADLYRQLRGAHSIGTVDLQHVFRQRSQQAFGNLGTRYEAKRTFDDLVVSDDLLAQLKELLAAVQYREQVLARGFDRKIAYGTGISALFHGDSGTGKTLVAEVLAGALGVDVIKVDLASVVNKYVGETEKNLSKIFDMAEADSGLLFFDEADALFGKRSETRDAHDRYANIEVSYLLQRLENYPGLVVLATNNRTHLDDAFTRRLTFIIRFSFPDAALRERMWRGIWPAGVEVDSAVDFAAMARRADITGASVRNIALLACWLAASEKAPRIQQKHLDLALKRELGKLGRVHLGN